MTESRNRLFTTRPGAADQWIRASGPGSTVAEPSTPYTARLTIDVTPDVRRRLKLAALQRGVTVAEMVRVLFDREFPQVSASE